MTNYTYKKQEGKQWRGICDEAVFSDAMTPESWERLKAVAGPIAPTPGYGYEKLPMALKLIKYATKHEWLCNIMSEYIPTRWGYPLPDDSIFLFQYDIIIEFSIGFTRSADGWKSPHRYLFFKGWSGPCTLMQLALWIREITSNNGSCNAVFQGRLTFVTPTDAHVIQLLPDECNSLGCDKSTIKQFAARILNFISECGIKRAYC